MGKLTIKEINEIQRLAKKGISLNKISKQLKIPKTTIYYHAKELVKKCNTQFNENFLNCWEKGYIIGLFVGDGSILTEQKRGQYVTKFHLDNKKDQDIVKKIEKLIQKTGQNSYKIVYGGTITVCCMSKKFVEFVKKYVEYIKTKLKSNIKKLRKMKKSRKFILGFVAGFLDSDGFVGFDKGKYIRALISNKDKNLLLATKEMLNKIKIKSSFHKAGNVYILRISTPELEKNKCLFQSLKMKRVMGP